MNRFLQFLLFIIIAIFAIYVTTAIANFFSIQFQYYGVYLIFALAMGLLFYALPKQYPNIFVEKLN